RRRVAGARHVRRPGAVGTRWIHEIKFDGYGGQVHITDGAVTIFRRRGNDWTKRFGKIAADAFEVNADRRSSMVRMVRPLSRERTAPPTFCPAKRIEGRARPFDFALSQRLRLAKADVGRAQGTARVTCRRIRTCSSAIVSRLTAAKWTSIRVRSGLRASSLRYVTAVMCLGPRQWLG